MKIFNCIVNCDYFILTFICSGDEFLLNCSGFVIDRNDVIATIITSASLVIGDEDSIPNNITVSLIESSLYILLV